MITKWEYRRYFHDSDRIDKMEILVEYGQEGWELCAIESFSSSTVSFYFKRPLPQPEAKPAASVEQMKNLRATQRAEALKLAPTRRWWGICLICQSNLSAKGTCPKCDARPA